MTWLTNLDPRLTAAIISAIVALIVAMITALLAPTVKYGLDMRLERRKLELSYRAEQSKALRDHIGFHKGAILGAADELAVRLGNYQATPDAPTWLQNKRGYYARSFAFRILANWAAIERFNRQAVYIDARVATRPDWTFLKAAKLNLDAWSAVRLFDGLGYSGFETSDHFFRGQITTFVDSLTYPGSDRSRTWGEFGKALDEGSGDFDELFNFLSGLDAKTSQLKYQRLMAVDLVIIATLNSFGYDYQRKPPERIREISARCCPEVRANLRQMMVDLNLEKEQGFRELAKVLKEGPIASRSTSGGTDLAIPPVGTNPDK